MKHLLRPYRTSQIILGCAALFAAACLLLAPQRTHAQAETLTPIFADPDPLVAHASPSGYLGVEVTDVDADKAQALKLKEVRGAVITLIDHDAPAGQIGLKVNDVVLAINGQNVEGAEQLRRMLARDSAGPQDQPRDQPRRQHSNPGRATGRPQGHGAEHLVAASAWMPTALRPPRRCRRWASWPAATRLLPPPSGFHMSLFTSTLNVGAMVEPLTSQMAEYLGVPGGLMIKQVSKKSEAATAGFKAFDVILKVGSDSINTLADWDRALRSNQGKPVQVTILRDKKQQTITLQVDSKHRGAVEFDDLFASGDASELAELAPALDSDMIRAMTAEAQADAEAAAAQTRQQVDAVRKQLDTMRLQMSQEQIEQLRQQAQKLSESMKNSQIDQEQLRKQIEQQMEQFRKSLNGEPMKQLQQQLQQQMKQFRQQMEEWREESAGHFV